MMALQGRGIQDEDEEDPNKCGANASTLPSLPALVGMDRVTANRTETGETVECSTGTVANRNRCEPEPVNPE